MLPLDSKVLVEIIKMYRDSPCLWDQTHLLYSNKEARKKAYDMIFDTVKICKDGANLKAIKKKIENMRTTYKREVRKVMASRAEGGEEYRPTLWYYDLMSFLEVNSDGGNSPNYTEMDDGNNEESPSESEYAFEEYLEDEPKPKKMKKSSIYGSEMVSFIQDSPSTKPKLSSVFLPNDDNGEIAINTLNDNNAASSFGKTVGLQLKELDHVQRIIAEKLISDTIFHARLNQLTINSCIQLNSEFGKINE